MSGDDGRETSLIVENTFRNAGEVFHNQETVRH